MPQATIDHALNSSSTVATHSNGFPYNVQQHAPVMDKLAATLTLTIEGETFRIPGANIRYCHLHTHLYGFNGEVGFWLCSDKSIQSWHDGFNSEAIIVVDLQLQPVLNLPDNKPKPLRVNGCVLEKCLTQPYTKGVAGNPNTFCFYQISFADTARVLWTQHFPTRLYTNETIKTVIEEHCIAAPHANGTPLITLDFDDAETVLPLICLPLGNVENATPGQSGHRNSASFYDFLIHYASNNNLNFIYDYNTQTYSLSSQKPEAITTDPFLPYELQSIETFWPATNRSNTSLFNALADNPKQKDLTNQQAVDGIYKEKMYRYPIQNDFNTRSIVEKQKLQTYGEQLIIHFNQWPIKTFIPNSAFSVNATVEGNKRLYSGKNYRLVNLSISLLSEHSEAVINRGAVSVIQTTDKPDSDTGNFHISYKGEAELATSTRLHLPMHSIADYPILVEGKVVSTVGNDRDKTYNITKNANTQQLEYSVYIPLWDKTINILFEPDFINSHFFFPFYRDIRLLLSIDMYRAYINKVLSWGSDVQLPLETQGNHILFGKNNKDETSLRHIYEENKPVLNIKRQKANDTELLRLQEGSIILQTCEE